MNFNSDLTPAELTTLMAVADECSDFKSPHYLEVGVFEGGTMKKMIEADCFRSYTGIDLFEDWRPDPSNTHVSGTVSIAEMQSALPKGTFLKGDSARIMAGLNPRAGLIFIDGNHKFLPTLADLLLAIRLLEQGSFLAIHNVTTDKYPDINYVADDGGPHAVMQLAKKFYELNFISVVDRLAIFEKL